MDRADRTRLYRAFIAKWGHRDYPPDPESEEALCEVERELGFALPGAYRQFMREIGPVISHGGLLRALTAARLDVRDLSEFYPARDLVRATLGWRRSNLPEDLMPIASDGSGNQFCMRPAAAPPAEADGPVWLWKHESDTSEQVAESFAAWLSRLLEVQEITEG